MTDPLGEHFPIWSVSMRTPRLDVVPLREEHMAALIALIDAGLHDPATMPFVVPFTDTPSPQREQESIAFWLGCWAGVSPQGWRLPFVALRDGVCVGLQDIGAVAFADRRTVETGSWLGMAHQGRGYGTEMRAAVLHLAFGHLGAERAESAAFEDNAASIRVSERLGYRPDGHKLTPRRSTPQRQVLYAIDRADWSATAAHGMDVTVGGVDDAVLTQLGAT